jgi:hypothetical protein
VQGVDGKLQKVKKFLHSVRNIRGVLRPVENVVGGSVILLACTSYHAEFHFS